MGTRPGAKVSVVGGILVTAVAVAGLFMFMGEDETEPVDLRPSAVTDRQGEFDSPESSAASPEVEPAAHTPLVDEPETHRSTTDAGNRVDLSESAPSHYIRGWIRSEQGTPLEGATVSWTAWDPRFLPFVSASVVIPADQIESHSVVVISNEQGWFQLEEQPPLLADEPSYLWVTHPSYGAQMIEVAPGASDLEGEQEVRLTPFAAMSALVLHKNSPVAGAIVSQQAAFPRDTDAPMDLGVHAPKGLLLFLRQYRSAENGTVRLAPASHSHRLIAQHEELYSLPWSGEAGLGIELKLEATCTLTGFLSFPPEYEETWGLPHVRVLRYHGPFVEEIATIAVRSDGTIGPDLIPVLPAQNYALQLGGGGFVPAERVIGTPTVGQNLHHELQGEIGGTLWFMGFDEDGEVLKGITVRVDWQERGRVVEKSVGGRGDGYARVTGLPAGVVTCEITAPGFDLVRSGPITIPEQSPTVHQVTLHAGLQLRGTCLQGTDPTRNFEVRYWAVTNQSYRGKVRVTDSEDGSFFIDSVTYPQIALEAISEEFGRSVVTTIDLNNPSHGDVRLQIEPALAMSGTVIDPATGEPVSGAAIDVYNSSVRYALDTIGAPVITGASGGFEVRRLRAGRNIVSISAEGFSSRELSVIANGERVDLGKVELRKRQPLTARLLLPEGEDPSQYLLVTSGVGAISPTRFDSRGELRIESASEGSFVYQVRESAGGSTVLTWKRYTLLAGEEWHLEFQLIPGKRRIRITTSGLDPGTPPTEYLAGVTYPDPDGNEDFRSVRLDAAGEAVVPGLIGEGPVSVRVAAAQGTKAGGTAVMIGEGGPDEILIHVKLNSRVVDMRVVDTEGVPLPGIEVLPRASKAEGIVLGWEITDSKGEAHFNTLALQTDQVTLSSRSGGTIDRVPFEFPSREGEWVELVFDMGSSIALTVHDGGVPQSAANCRLFSGEHGYTLTPGRTPDENGHVTFSDLGAGFYELQVDVPGCWPVSRQVEATPAGSKYTVEVRRVGTLALEIVGADGNALAGQVIDLKFIPLGQEVGDWAHAGKLPGHQGPLTTDSYGQLRIEGIPRGQYQWSCRGASGSFTLVAGNVLEERLVVP